MEYKSFDFDLKSVEEDGTFEGYAAVFGNIDALGDVIDQGAFTKTLAEHPRVPILWQHDTYEPIGVGSENTPDGYGLHAKGLIVPTLRGADALRLMRARAIGGLSIGYKTIQSQSGKSADGYKRKLMEVRLYEYSLVTFPANDLAQVTQVKALLERMNSGNASLEMLLSALKTSGAIEVTEVDELWSALDLDLKAGRTLSTASRAAVAKAIESLQALLDEADGPTGEAAKSAVEPDDVHSAVAALRNITH